MIFGFNMYSRCRAFFCRLNFSKAGFKKSAAVFLFAFVFSFAYSLDYGFLLRNDTDLKNGTDSTMFVEQKDSFYAWIKVPFGNDSPNYFIAEGMYQFDYLSNSNVMYHYLDVDLLKVYWQKDFSFGFFELNAGRFFTGDLTSIIYSQNADGVFTRLKNNIADVSLYCAYTGLLNANVTKMIGSPDYKGADPTKVYSLQDKYLNAMATASFVNLFANQTLEVQALASFHLSKTQFDRYYVTLGIYGPIWGNLLYNVAASCGMKSETGKDFVVSPLVRARIAYYFTQVSVGLETVYAGKDFTGITNIAALNSLSEPYYSSLWVTGLSATYKPIENLLLKAGADVAFDVKRNNELKGFQYDVSADWQITSDVLFALSWKQYFDINKTDVSHNDLSVKARIAF